MFKNSFKTAWRHVVKDRQFTLLNLIGLSTGLACTLLIYLWVIDEMRMDKFNESDSRIFQVLHNITTPNGIETIENTQGLLAKTLGEEMPEVQYAASVIPAGWFSNRGLFSINNKHIRAGGQFVSKDYFNIFSVHFIQGNKQTALTDKYQIALSAELAQKLFNSINVVGRTVEWNQEGFTGIYQVSAVFDKFPSNSTVQFDALFNYDLFLEKNPKLQKWGNSDPNTYVLLKKGADAEQLNKKLKDLLKSKNEKATATLFAQRFSDKYLHNHYENGVPAGGRIEYVKLFSIIALFILIIACINFMNLSTAKAAGRLKEIGVKKVMGADRGSLVFQYLTESLMMATIATLFALALVWAILPQFNIITGKQLGFHMSTSLVIAILIITLITGLIAGSYPALYLSRFKPIAVLKGKIQTSLSELLARKGLVIFQFTLSSVLIICVLIVYRQIKLVQTKNLGYNREQVVYFEKGGKLSGNKEDYKQGGAYEKELDDFLQRIKNIPGVVNASNFRHNITNRHGGTTDVEWEGKLPGDETSFTDIAAGYDFIETLGIEMKQGRTYSREDGAAKGKVIFNEAAIKSMGLKDPVGKTVKIWGEEKQIIGVTKDFNFESLYETIKPCFFDFSLNHRASKIMLKIEPRTENATLERIAKFYKAHTGEALEYKFLDEDYRQLYESESRVGVLSRYFAGLAIIISCLGLFGLVTFSAHRRQKEIGIRKVVGASVTRVALMLSGDFLKLVGIAVLIAFPVSWWLMNEWLKDFAYRISIEYTVFVIAAFSMLALSFITISYQAIKAATANPVKSLRTE